MLPDLLFVRGAMISDRGVAVVGSRKATSYGRGLARAYGAALGSSGWPVISGLARGVDGAAHQGTLDVAGRGIAVLGCGLDVWYPPEHRSLGEGLLGGRRVRCQRISARGATTRLALSTSQPDHLGTVRRRRRR